MTKDRQNVRRAAVRLAGIASLLALVALAASPAGKEPVDLLIVNARLVTVDRRLSVFDPGALAVNDGVIVAVGPTADLSSRFSAQTIFEAAGKIVLPGLVNTHTHAAMTLLRGLADDLPLDLWLSEHVFPAEARNVSPQFVYDGTLLAALEMIQGGTTTFADMYYFEGDAARAVDEAGMRAVLGETFIDFPVPDHKDLPSTIAFTQAFFREWKSHPRIVPAVAPHAPYTCSRETLLAARELAVGDGLPILIHVAETRKEAEEARAKWGVSEVAYLDRIGFLGGASGKSAVPLVAAHCVWVDAEERALLKRRGVAVSHNPESNMKLASGIAPVAAMAKEGLLWAIGTDGPGSNNDLSMFEAMDVAGKLAKATTLDPTVLPAPDLIVAATRSGARALGLGGKIGSLEPGKRADLIVVDVRNAHATPFTDVYSALVYSAKASDVTDVWVDGRRLLAAGRPTSLDPRAILDAADRWRKRVARSLSPSKKAS